MKNNIRDRVLRHARFFLKRDVRNIRHLAEITGYSKTTVHNDLRYKLEKIHPELYTKVLEKLEFNKSVRHLRGGYSTKQKWDKKKNK